MRSNAPELDSKIIKKAKAGDEEAFAHIYEAWAQPVYNFIFRKVESSDVAEDITADVFVRMWKALPSHTIMTQAHFRAWVYTLCRNAVIDYYRTKQSDVSIDDVSETPDPNFAKAFDIGLTEKEGLMLSHMDGLQTDFQKVLKLRFVDGHSIAKVAQIMRKKEGAIRTLTHRALKALKDAMGSS